MIDVGSDHADVADELRRLRSWWDAPDGPLVMSTSGSSGEPKRVALSRAALAASVAATETRLGGPGQWVLDLPVDRIAGLQVLLRSIAAGTEPVVASEHPTYDAAVAAVDADRAYTAVVPTQLHRLATSGRLSVLRRFDAVLVGGAAVRADLMRCCADEGVRVVRTYGMTETCGGCVYDGVPLDGVGVRIAADGRVHVAGPVLFDGYEGDAEATSRALVDGWFVTEDLGRLDDDGRLVVLGRFDDVVVSGGANVSLPAVTEALVGLGGVTDAVAVGLPDDEWGTRVVACLACHGPTPQLAEVREHVATRLPRAWAPRSVVPVDAVPRLPGGKVDRLALRRLAEEGT
ncbi:MAG TPA: AMP-binding protein [Nocardioidaceae bacterium]|nr:AMP-binding protein [Nocardioidaceae bacterium]